MSAWLVVAGQIRDTHAETAALAAALTLLLMALSWRWYARYRSRRLVLDRLFGRRP